MKKKTYMLPHTCVVYAHSETLLASSGGYKVKPVRPIRLISAMAAMLPMTTPTNPMVVTRYGNAFLKNKAYLRIKNYEDENKYG